MIATEIDSDLVYSYKLSKTIKFLAIIDGIFALLALYFNGWLSLMFFGAIAGYYGAVYFNKYQVLFYAVCQITIALTRLGYTAAICYLNETWPVNLILWTTFMFLLELYIARFVLKFYNNLKIKTPEEIEQLKALKNINVQIVYW